jgi:hypothetical protein
MTKDVFVPNNIVVFFEVNCQESVTSIRPSRGVFITGRMQSHVQESVNLGFALVATDQSFNVQYHATLLMLLASGECGFFTSYARWIDGEAMGPLSQSQSVQQHLCRLGLCCGRTPHPYPLVKIQTKGIGSTTATLTKRKFRTPICCVAVVGHSKSN